MQNIVDSRTVKIFLKEDASKTNRLGQGATMDMIYNSYRIGSAIRHGDVLRGLSFKEEETLLPDIIGHSTKSPDWKKATRDYWCDITLEVMPNDINGYGGGLVLETGFVYPDQASATKGRKEEEKEISAFNKSLEIGKEYEMDYTVRYEVGRIINPANFIAYKFILKHPEVANRVDDLYKTPRILYYIHSQQIENKIKHVALKARKEAYIIFMELIDEPLKAKYVLSLLHKEISALVQKNKTTYDLSTDMGRQIVLEDLAREKPTRLLAVSKDKHLIEKAFVEECIKMSYLKRIANTDTIMYGDNTLIGYNLDQAIIYLRDPANASTKQKLEAMVTNWAPLLKDNPSKKLVKKQAKPESKGETSKK